MAKPENGKLAKLAHIEYKPGEVRPCYCGQQPTLRTTRTTYTGTDYQFTCPCGEFGEKIIWSAFGKEEALKSWNSKPFQDLVASVGFSAANKLMECAV